MSEAVEVQCLPADIYQLYAECLGMTSTSGFFESHTHTDGPQKSKKDTQVCDMIFLYPEEMGMMATLQRQLDQDETMKQSRFWSEVCQVSFPCTTTVAFSEIFHDASLSGAGGCWSLKGPALGTTRHLT